MLLVATVASLTTRTFKFYLYSTVKYLTHFSFENEKIKRNEIAELKNTFF